MFLPRAQNGDPVGNGRPTDTMRLDGLNHWPNSVATRARCCHLKGCQQRSTFWCTKCRVYLCLKGRKNCFMQYHTEA